MTNEYNPYSDCPSFAVNIGVYNIPTSMFTTIMAYDNIAPIFT